MSGARAPVVELEAGVELVRKGVPVDGVLAAPRAGRIPALRQRSQTADSPPILRGPHRRQFPVRWEKQGLSSERQRVCVRDDLRHEAADDAVERRPVVVALQRQLHKVAHRLREQACRL